jgi:hypothetical protein
MEGDTVSFYIKTPVWTVPEGWNLQAAYVSIESLEGTQGFMEITPPFADWTKIDVPIDETAMEAEQCNFYFTVQYVCGDAAEDLEIQFFIDDFSVTYASVPDPSPEGPACGNIWVNSILLENPTPVEPIFEIRRATKIALDGTQKFVSSGNYGRSWTFVCRSSDHDTIDLILSTCLGGYVPLVFCDGDNQETYEYCVVTGFQEAELTPELWQYTITITEDNSGVY